MQKEESSKQDMCKIIKDFTTDILTSFPEYSENLNTNLVNLCKIDDNTSKEFILSRDQIFNYCKETYPPKFFDILYQNEKVFENDINFLPDINFKVVWESNISDKTRETIWKYLQLILFTITVNLDNNDSFGDTANLFEAINEDELKSKLEETMGEMHKMFDLSGNDSFPDISNINLDNMPEPAEIHEHINGMLGGKLGNLAKEIAEETANEMNLDTEDATSMNDIFQKLFKNPGKLMNLVKSVGEKLDAKIKSGEIKESELIAEASDMMNKMKNMPGMGGMQDMLNKMAGGKVNMNAMEAKMQQNMKKATQKERMLNKLNAKRAAEAAMAAQMSAQMGASTNTNTSTETVHKVFSSGETVQRTPIDANKGNKKKRRKNKNKNK